MTIEKINIKEKFTLFNEQWSPKIIAQLNDYHFKIAKIEGEFVWHSHARDRRGLHRDRRRIRDAAARWQPDPHRRRDVRDPQRRGAPPVAEKECAILMVELAGTLNTGDAGGEHTIEELDWV